MRYFVPHDTSQFRFGLCLQDEAGVDEKEATGQCKGIHLFAIQHLDGEWHLGVGVANKVLPDAIHIFGNGRVGNNFRLAFDFLGQLFAQSDFLIQRIEVDTFADVAIANRVRIVLRILFGVLCQTVQ